MFAVKYPELIWQQYIQTCTLVSLLSLVDIMSYFVVGEVFLTFRPDIFLGELPRISTFFSEMSHQAFFLLPAILSSVRSGNIKNFVIHVVGFLLAMSVGAILMFVVLLLIILLTGKNKAPRTRVISSSLIFVLIFLSVVLINQSGFVSDKVSLLFSDDLYTLSDSRRVSGMGVVLGFDLITHMDINELLIGKGYSNSVDEVANILARSDRYDYYNRAGYLQDVAAAGAFRFLYSYGIIVSFFVVMVIYMGRKWARDQYIYSMISLVLVASLFKHHHILEMFYHSYLMFCLAWACFPSAADYALTLRKNHV